MTQILTSLQTLIPNTNFADLPLFDRTGWRRVRFSDVVENCAETCNPEEADLERFIAMEHLEPGSLHIRSWGNVADGTTFTRRCRPGQVLFGKRRAYQRKVAVAQFDAVVSGDIYVFAPKDSERLLPELLPFLCMSERFFQHAVGTSAGSLSPRTNWSSLATFEFDLPPLDQQRRIAEILWAVDEAKQKWIDVQTKLSDLRFSYARVAYGIDSGSSTRITTSQTIPLSELMELNPTVGIRVHDETIVSFLGMADVSEDGYVIRSDVKAAKEVKIGFTAFRDRDILFAKITPCMENGKGALVSDLCNGIGFGSTEFHVLRPKHHEDAEYIFHLTKLPSFRRAAKRYMRGSAGQQRVPADFLREYRVTYVDITRRKEIGQTLDQMANQIKQISIMQTKFSLMTATLLNYVYGALS